MINAWILLSGLSWAGFGGASVGVVGEVDTVGSELLVDVGVRPYELQRGSLTLTWAPADLSWGVLPTTERLDRVQVGVLEGERRFTSGKAGAHFRLGEFLYDQEDAVMDLTFAQGGVVMHELDDRLDVRIGADVRLRWPGLAGSGNDPVLLLGLPVGVSYEHVLTGPVFLLGHIDARPNIGLLGGQTFVFDGIAGAQVGVHALQEREATLDVTLGYAFRTDTYTDPSPATLEHRMGLNLVGRF